MRQLDNWLEAYSAFVADSEGDAEYKKWMGIAVIASALERKVYIEWDHIRTIYCNFFIALVGSSASRKSTIMIPGERLLRDLDCIQLAPKDVTGAWLVNRMAAIGQPMPGQNGITHASMTAFCPELGVFIGNDRNVKWYQSLCQLFDCEDRFDKGTIIRDIEIIDNVWLNLVGCITPLTLKEVMPETALVGGGLSPRFIFVWGNPVTDRITIGRKLEEMAVLRGHLLHDLKLINLMEGGFTVTPEFLALYHEFYQAGEYSPALVEHEERFSAYMERKPTHLLKVAMVLSVARDSKMLLIPEDFGIAQMFLDTTEISMPRVFTHFGEKQIGEAHFMRILSLVKVKGPIKFSELYHFFYEELDEHQFFLAIQTLANITPPYLSLNSPKERKDFRKTIINFIKNDKGDE